MADTLQDERPAPRRRQALLPALAVALNLFAIATVCFWIYRARALFIAAHPEYVARRPPTISRAISDPAIGEPFEAWLTVAAILLVIGVAANALFYRGLMRTLPPSCGRTARWLGVLMPSVVLLQGTASTGILMLSSYRFPDHDEMHMAGSFLFFLSQTGVVAAGTLAAATLLRDRVALEWGEGRRLLRRGALRLRLGFGLGSLAMAGVYVALFTGKDAATGVFEAPVYLAYVTVEPLLITCFLMFLGLFQTDLLALARAQRRS